MSWQPNESYPISAFPRAMREVALELQNNVQAPIELIAPQVLGVAALACQNSVDVQRPNCAPSACSLNILLFAGSGEGKSTILAHLDEAVREFEDEKATEFDRHFAITEAEFRTWEIEHKVTLTEIEKRAKKSEETTDLQTRLSQLIKRKPIPRSTPRLTYEDPTPEAVISGLCHVWPSAAVVSAEGGSFFNGRASNDLATWNKIWDGRGLSVERKVSGITAHRSPRCSLLIATQDGPFRRFYERRGVEAQESGFLPRFLVSYPPSNRGTRFLSEREMKWDALTTFKIRVKSILANNIEAVEGGRFERAVLRFSADAAQRWTNAYNKVESLAGPGQYLCDVQGYAAKIAENIARVAAIFHYFEGCDGDISLDTMDRAVRVCEWHSHEYKRLFSSGSPMNRSECSADLLEQWLRDYGIRTGLTVVKKNWVRQHGPYTLRDRERLNNALEELIRNYKISVYTDGRRTKVINIHGLQQASRI